LAAHDETRAGGGNGVAGDAGRRAAALAKAAHVFALPELPDLVYVTDAMPGIRRVRRGKGFSYHDAEGRLLVKDEVVARIRRLAIPPAWTDVWISPLPEGHLQATGRDAKNRKQYLYHPRYREVREADKFGRLARFGQALPAIRDRADADLSRRSLDKEKVLAAVVTLLDRTLIRVGNEAYARTNEAYGLTTLRDEHALVSGSTLRFVFRGKGGKEHAVDLSDRRLARAVRRCQELAGEELFQYQDDDGTPRPVSSQDVNMYLRETAGEVFTAKDFRTWGGTVVVARELAQMGPFETKTQADRNVNQALDAAAGHLNNTRAVARRSYVHPEVVASYLEGELVDLWPRLVSRADRSGRLAPEEVALLGLLKRRASAKSKAGTAPSGNGDTQSGENRASRGSGSAQSSSRSQNGHRRGAA
jgi:DNA topoisomerase I